MFRSPSLIMPVRGLRVDDACRYVGFSRSRFLEMTAEGTMPAGFTHGRVRLWDILDLDEAFERLKAASEGKSSPSESATVDEGWDGVAP